MKPLLDALRPWIDRWQALALPRRMVLIAALALMVGGGMWAWAAANQVSYGVLFSGLESGDAAAIVERLKGQKVAYKLERAGTEIWVPEAAVYETRLSLAGEGLPNGGGQGFELFDQQKFGESEFSEQVKYHRALEGELTRTITHLAGVDSARVHLVLPSRSVFVNSENTASASVALRLKPGAKLSRDQVKGLVHLIASSVRGLSPENVTIIDGSGRRLSGGEDESEIASNSLEFQRNYEHAQERSLQQILDATVGPGRAMVRVAADVSFAHEETTEERVDPNLVAARSFQITEERDTAGSSSAAGVPGAVGTLEGADTTMNAGNANGITRRSETRNFEISKTTRRAVEPVGRVMRLSVAVVVDGTWKGKGDKRTFVIRPAAELATIKSVVATAAGTKEERGDKVTVECVPFAEQPVELAEQPVTGVEALVKKNLPAVAGGAGALLLLAVGGTVFLMSRKKKVSTIDLKLPAEAPAQLKVETAQAIAPASIPPTMTESPALSADAQAEAEKIRALTAEIASGDPYLAARVVRGWLSEGTSEEAA
jgi:flagellar M-ring protein FliF